MREPGRLNPSKPSRHEKIDLLIPGVLTEFEEPHDVPCSLLGEIKGYLFKSSRPFQALVGMTTTKR